MSEDGKRPGGLTALAVLNFVFGGLGAIGLIGIFALIGAAEHVVVTSGATTSGATTSTTTTTSTSIGYTYLLLATLTSGLLIASGVGYLGLKKFLGRTLGNAYGIISLAYSAMGISVAGFGIMTMIGLVYPLLTLALLNTTFKDDLVR